MSEAAKQLRDIARCCRDWNIELRSAADEIERLQADVDSWQKTAVILGEQRDQRQGENVRLQASLDTVQAAAVNAISECSRLRAENERLQDKLRDAEDVRDQRWQMAKEAKAEIERLQAIVDRLPKTADGVPITPGITIWDSIGVKSWEVTGVNTRLGKLSCVYGPNGSFDAICSGYYSTREAAEKARTP